MASHRTHSARSSRRTAGCHTPSTSSERSTACIIPCSLDGKRRMGSDGPRSRSGRARSFECAAANARTRRPTLKTQQRAQGGWRQHGGLETTTRCARAACGGTSSPAAPVTCGSSSLSTIVATAPCPYPQSSRASPEDSGGDRPGAQRALALLAPPSSHAAHTQGANHQLPITAVPLPSEDMFDGCSFDPRARRP